MKISPISRSISTNKLYLFEFSRSLHRDFVGPMALSSILQDRSRRVVRGGKSSPNMNLFLFEHMTIGVVADTSLSPSRTARSAKIVHFKLPVTFSRENQITQQATTVNANGKPTFNSFALRRLQIPPKSSTSTSKDPINANSISKHRENDDDDDDDDTVAFEFPAFEPGPQLLEFLHDAVRSYEELNDSRRLEYFHEAFDAFSREKSSISYQALPNRFFLVDAAFIEALGTVLTALKEQYLTKLTMKRYVILFRKVFEMDWSISNESFVETYIDFVTNLLSAQPGAVVLCLELMLKTFSKRKGPDVKSPEFVDHFNDEFRGIVSVESQSASFSRIHCLIARLITILPRLEHFLVPLIQFPFIKAPVEEQRIYFENVLQICSYFPKGRNALFKKLLANILRLDVEIQAMIEDLDDEQLDELLVSEEEKLLSKSFDEDLYLKERGDDVEDGQSEVSGSTPHKNETDTEVECFIKVSLGLLDEFLCKIFEFIHEVYPREDAASTSSDEMYLSKLQEWRLFFVGLLEFFEESLLTTMKSRMTQYVLFYAASIEELRLNSSEADHRGKDPKRTNSYHDLFLGLLMDKLFDSDLSSTANFRRYRKRKHGGMSSMEFDTVKLIAISYLASYLARCKTVNSFSLKYSMNLFFTWCDNYLSLLHLKRSNSYGSSCLFGNDQKISGEHVLFYAVCQAVFYIFCFRHADLLEPPGSINKSGIPASPNVHMHSKYSVILKSFFEKIVYCTLNPLRRTLPSISEEFSKICKRYQLLYCDNMLQSSSSKSSSSSSTSLNTSPFTPQSPLLSIGLDNAAMMPLHRSMSCPASRSVTPSLYSRLASVSSSSSPTTILQLATASSEEELTQLSTDNSSSSYVHLSRSSSSSSSFAVPAPVLAQVPFQPFLSTASSSSLASSTTASASGLLKDLENFFPFDPLILKKSGKYITSEMFLEWGEDDDDDDDGGGGSTEAEEDGGPLDSDLEW